MKCCEGSLYCAASALSIGRASTCREDESSSMATIVPSKRSSDLTKYVNQWSPFKMLHHTVDLTTGFSSSNDGANFTSNPTLH